MEEKERLFREELEVWYFCDHPEIVGHKSTYLDTGKLLLGISKKMHVIVSSIVPGPKYGLNVRVPSL